MTTTIYPIPMPTDPQDYSGWNWAEEGTAAWIAEFGGRDVSGQRTDADADMDYTSYVGDVEIDGTVYRLTCPDDGRDEIRAEAL